jgi:3-oxoacyl-(acyl-carrier-protein) synthase
MTGHLLGAAGAVESIACIYAINNSIIPPTINFKVEDPEIDYNMDLTLNHPKKKEIRVAMNNTFGFGGHNSCLVFKAIK